MNAFLSAMCLLKNEKDIYLEPAWADLCFEGNLWRAVEVVVVGLQRAARLPRLVSL